MPTKAVLCELIPEMCLDVLGKPLRCFWLSACYRSLYSLTRLLERTAVTCSTYVPYMLSTPALFITLSAFTNLVRLFEATLCFLHLKFFGSAHRLCGCCCMLLWEKFYAGITFNGTNILSFSLPPHPPWCPWSATGMSAAVTDWENLTEEWNLFSALVTKKNMILVQ